MNELPLLGEIRHLAIMAQPETLWTHVEKLKAAEAWQTMDVHENFALYKILVSDDGSAFIGWKDNYLGYLFILPEIQGRNTGSELLKLAETDMHRKYDHAWLFSHPYSEKFYEKHGYIKQPETEDPFGTTLLHKFVKKF